MESSKSTANHRRSFSLVFLLFVISMAVAMFAIWAESKGWGEYWHAIGIAFSLAASVLGFGLFAIGAVHYRQSKQDESR
jgi:RsiW-degrading membrane proteinase PrsW (M82 family)